MLLELKALGAEYVVVHGPKSREFYHDFFHTERISSHLPAVFHLEDDTVYRLPVRSIAHLMKADELPDADVMAYPQTLSRYVAAVEDASRPVLAVHWKDTSELTIAGPVPAGDLVALLVSANRCWRATQAGHEIPWETDRLGFIVLHPAAAPATQIDLRYHGTMEQRMMAGLECDGLDGSFRGFVLGAASPGRLSSG